MDLFSISSPSRTKYLIFKNLKLASFQVDSNCQEGPRYKFQFHQRYNTIEIMSRNLNVVYELLEIQKGAMEGAKNLM